VHSFDDVAACPQLSELGRPAVRELPRHGREALGQSKALEVLEARDERGLVDPPAFRAGSRRERHHLVDRTPFESPVERRESLLRNLLYVSPPDRELRPRAELAGGELLSATPNAVRDVRAIEAHLVPVPVDPANDDVRVRVLGVVMIHGRPLEAPSRVLLDLRHQAPHERRQVELARVLRRDDPPKLVLLPRPWLGEVLPARRAIGAIENPLAAVALDAIALDVAKVQGGPLGVALPRGDDARLHDDPSRERSRRQRGLAKARVSGFAGRFFPPTEPRLKDREVVFVVYRGRHLFSSIVVPLTEP
jgi:hypothetical protein